MSELIQTGFDYGDLSADKVLECEAAFQAACAIEEQATRMIGEQFAKVKENLKFLRNGNGWMEWCKVKLKISHTQAQNYINEFENGESLKNLSTFGKSARFLLTAPNTPQEVRDRADAIAEAGGDISHKAIKQLKADVEAERQARLVAAIKAFILDTDTRRHNRRAQRSMRLAFMYPEDIKRGGDRRSDDFKGQICPLKMEVRERKDFVMAQFIRKHDEPLGSSAPKNSALNPISVGKLFANWSKRRVNSKMP